MPKKKVEVETMPRKQKGKEQFIPEVLHVTPIGRDTMAAKALFEELTQGKGRKRKAKPPENEEFATPLEAVRALWELYGGDNGIQPSGPRPVVLYLDKQGIKQLRRILDLPEPSKPKHRIIG